MNILNINEKLRLRPYDGKHDFALSWYQDPDFVYLVDGVKEPYDLDKLNRMYHYLNTHGQLYFIEIKMDSGFVPIGDVTLMRNDLPIAIGKKDFRQHGIGRLVIQALINEARKMKYDHLEVKCIYFYNLPSQRCFESLGFAREEKLKQGYRYRYDFQESLL